MPKTKKELFTLEVIWQGRPYFAGDKEPNRI